jgi:hypothetical protein
MREGTVEQDLRDLRVDGRWVRELLAGLRETMNLSSCPEAKGPHISAQGKRSAALGNQAE